MLLGIALAISIRRIDRADPPPPPGVALTSDSAENRQVVEALTALADRYESLVNISQDLRTSEDPADWMEHLRATCGIAGGCSARWRCPGSRTIPKPQRLRRADALIRRFAPDRPLPVDFRKRSLASQVETFAWSFHGEESHAAVRAGPRPSPSEVVQALGQRIAVAGSIRLPLLPALADYRAFLVRLPPVEADATLSLVGVSDFLFGFAFFHPLLL